MATVICMDGLGGHPEVTFQDLKASLQSYGHRVVFADITGIQTHEDRVQRVLEIYRAECLNPETARQGIFLLGQSAGGSAVHIAASRLNGNIALKGVICLSRAMPRFIWFMTPQLKKSMTGRLVDILWGRNISSTELEYSSLVEPLQESQRDIIVKRRQTIPGPEARTLSLWAPPLESIRHPELIIYGSCDQWISPDAHRKLCEKMDGRTRGLTCVEIKDAGHLTLASDSKDEVIEKIRNWIVKH